MRCSSFIAMSWLVLGSCTGTETDNPLVDYDRSTCKDYGVETALVPPQVGEEDAGVAERYCFEWQASGDGALHLEVINYPSGCAVDFSSANAVLGERTLALTIQRASCAVARCGSCRYDLSFDVREVSASRALVLDLNERDCNGEPIAGAQETLVLPIDTQREGALCQSEDGAFTLE